VDLLLAFPEFIGPGIFKGLVLIAGGEEGHGRNPFQRRAERARGARAIIRPPCP
jgi:hypothetical protein